MQHPVAYVQHRQHPRGDPGSRLSTHEAAAKARAARMDPQVHAWAMDQLQLAQVNSSDPIAAAKALLSAIRKDKLYVPDPVDGEFIVSPECLLGTCGGIKFGGGDCDDLSAGYACAALSVGVPGAAIVGQYNRDWIGQEVLGHVLAAVWTGERWWYADPSEPGLEFGSAGQSSREIWVDVMSGRILCNSTNCDPEQVHQPHAPVGSGDFVGVAGKADGAAQCVVDDSFPWFKITIGAALGAAFGLGVGSLLWRR